MPPKVRSIPTHKSNPKTKFCRRNMMPSTNRPKMKDAVKMLVPIANFSSDSLAKWMRLLEFSAEYGIKSF